MSDFMKSFSLELYKDFGGLSPNTPKSASILPTKDTIEGIATRLNLRSIDGALPTIGDLASRYTETLRQQALESVGDMPTPTSKSQTIGKVASSRYFDFRPKSEGGYRPEPSPAEARLANRHRSQRLRSLDGYRSAVWNFFLSPHAEQRLPGRWHLSEEGRNEAKEETSFGHDTHRKFTPVLREIFAHPNTRADLMASVDGANARTTEEIIKRVKRGENIKYDVAIYGSGAHAAAAAMHIRALYPELTIGMFDMAPQSGGQFRSYGPNPAFYMNSRVRPASRLEAGVPRTPGNINPFGPYSTLDLSDVVSAADYADNRQIGEVTALNGYLAANDVMVNTKYGGSFRGRDSLYRSKLVNRNPITGEITDFDVTSSVVIEAFGIKQQSGLTLPNRRLTPAEGYFDRNGLYRHFGNADNTPNHRPLQAFAGKDVVIGGGGDTSLTAIEALTGQLPQQTYGPYSTGRNARPRSITWIGAPKPPSGSEFDIVRCLRARYINGLGQILPKFLGDKGALIDPVVGRIIGEVQYNPQTRGEEYFVGVGSGPRTRSDGRYYEGSVLIDGTNIPDLLDPSESPGRYSVGPAFNHPLDSAAREVVEALGIGENTVALWATIPKTVDDATKAGQFARLMRGVLVNA